MKYSVSSSVAICSNGVDPNEKDTGTKWKLYMKNKKNRQTLVAYAYVGFLNYKAEWLTLQLDIEWISIKNYF